MILSINITYGQSIDDDEIKTCFGFKAFCICILISKKVNFDIESFGKVFEVQLYQNWVIAAPISGQVLINGFSRIM